MLLLYYMYRFDLCIEHCRSTLMDIYMLSLSVTLTAVDCEGTKVQSTRDILAFIFYIYLLLLCNPLK